MQKGGLTQLYFLILYLFVFIIPQFNLEEGHKLNILYYSLFYSLVLFSIVQIIFIIYNGKISTSILKNKSALWLYIFLSFSAISYLWSTLNSPITQIVVLIKILILITPILLMEFGEDRLSKLFKFYYYGTVLGSFQIIYNYFFVATFKYGIKRSFLLGIDSNESAILIAIGYSLALIYYLNNKNIWYLLSTVPQIAAVFYTGSRTGFVALFICTIIALFIFKIFKLQFLSIILVIVGFGFFLLLPSLVPQENIERIVNIGLDISEGNMSGRIAIWTQAFKLIPNKLFAGYGMNTFSEIMERYLWRVNAHNVFIKVQLELGLMGTFVIFMWTFHFIKIIIRNTSKFRPFLIMSFIVVMISFMQLSWIYHINFLVLISVLLNASGSLSKESLENSRINFDYR